ncbi:hypothetical protein D3C72_1233430 [compost metagenome]
MRRCRRAIAELHRRHGAHAAARDRHDGADAARCRRDTAHAQRQVHVHVIAGGRRTAGADQAQGARNWHARHGQGHTGVAAGTGGNVHAAHLERRHAAQIRARHHQAAAHGDIRRRDSRHGRNHGGIARRGRHHRVTTTAAPAASGQAQHDKQCYKQMVFHGWQPC